MSRDHRVTHRAARLPLDKSAGGGPVDNPTSQGFTYRQQNPVQVDRASSLLYNSFIDHDVFGPYNNTYLVDGMIGAGFSADALERKFGRNFGYYLHLHGSPLFVNRDEQVVKLSRNDLTLNVSEASEHIVLTHVKHKPSVIAASHVLSTYWDYLRFALSEVEEVILFGYSGLDTHLNILLRPYLKTIRLRVVEWSGAGDPESRRLYWQRTLGNVYELNRPDSITGFDQW